MSDASLFRAVAPPSSPTAAARLGAEITELCSYLYAAEYRLLTLIREFDAQKYWEEAGFCSCAHWLNFHCGIGMNAARERVRVAQALAGLPKISAAFERGTVSYSKVRAMTRVADAESEEYLLMIATHGTAHHVEKLVSQVRRAERLEDVEEAHARYEARELTHYYDEDGCLVIRARLPAEQGALVVKALEKAMDRAWKNESAGDDVTAETSEENEVADSEAEPIAARRADALVAMAEDYLNYDESAGSTADRYQVVVHVTAETSYLKDGPGVTAETSRRIACDSTLVRIDKDKNGKPLSIGRKSRSIPPPMRRALNARDKGCRFPGCTNTRFVDGHHVEHWADGGETSLDNLVLLCRHHHHLVHEGGFACEKDETGEIVFRDRHSTRLDETAPLQGIKSTDDLQRWLDREFFESGIEPDACVAKWHAGERMDWQMAVSAMFQR
ncbi:MAG: DUF222 domain-containing protein [Woeseiaceae bacterium]|nr:DUF222 domain-containing protein [Woeseiaceae bacterium]